MAGGHKVWPRWPQPLRRRCWPPSISCRPPRSTSSSGRRSRCWSSASCALAIAACGWRSAPSPAWDCSTSTTWRSSSPAWRSACSPAAIAGRCTGGGRGSAPRSPWRSGHRTWCGTRQHHWAAIAMLRSLHRGERHPQRVDHLHPRPTHHRRSRLGRLLDPRPSFSVQPCPGQAGSAGLFGPAGARHPHRRQALLPGRYVLRPVRRRRALGRTPSRHDARPGTEYGASGHMPSGASSLG